MDFENLLLRAYGVISTLLTLQRVKWVTLFYSRRTADVVRPTELCSDEFDAMVRVFIGLDLWWLVSSSVGGSEIRCLLTLVWLKTL